jgi:hypothetical protein
MYDVLYLSVRFEVTAGDTQYWEPKVQKTESLWLKVLKLSGKRTAVN